MGRLNETRNQYHGDRTMEHTENDISMQTDHFRTCRFYTPSPVLVAQRSYLQYLSPQIEYQESSRGGARSSLTRF